MARSGSKLVAVASSARGVVSRRALFERLEGAGRVSVVSAPAGSGKTFLLRSWIDEEGFADSAAWLSVQREERDAQRFWLSLLDAVRDMAAGSAHVRPLTAAPDLDGWVIVERLLEDLRSLEAPLWLVIDDLHELRSEEALRQLELLLIRAPPELRFVLSTRHDLRLGLHRVRLEGGLTEIRASDLRFSRDETRALFEGAGLELSDSALAVLHQRTEGWAAGLRLAALSLAGHPDPEGFAAEFSGSERTVAEYLLAEVLERQPPEVRRLLLRTSILEKVSGPLADLLTGGLGGERILQELEAANALVVSLSPRRSWFRYHHLFAELLQLELRRTTPGELPALHHTAAEWFVTHGSPVEAVRHAQAAQDWGLAARLLSEHWFGLYVDGQTDTAHDLVAGFPADAVFTDSELAAVKAADELNLGSRAQAERHLTLAMRGAASLPARRRGRIELMLAILRLDLAWLCGNVPAVIEEAGRLLEATEAAQLGLGEDLRALGLIRLGTAELWAVQVEAAERHLDQGVAMARQLGRPYLEFTGIAHGARAASLRPLGLAVAVERCRQAIQLADRHGWSEEPLAAAAYMAGALALVWQGRLDEAEPWLDRAERLLQARPDPAIGLQLRYGRGMLELARGHHEDARRAFETGEELAEPFVTAHPVARRSRALWLQTLVRLGEIERVDQVFAELDQDERESGPMRGALAVLRLAQDDYEAATEALAPVLQGTARGLNLPILMVEAFLLEAIARDGLGDAAATERALERALDLAEPDGMLLPFWLHRPPGLLERHAPHRTAHASLISDILAVLAGAGPATAIGEREPLREPLSDSETRILRYLPTNLSKREIAHELCVSLATVKTHSDHIYTKLGVHSRGEAVERARALGLLAPSVRR